MADKKINYILLAFAVLVIVSAIFFIQKSEVNPIIDTQNIKPELKEGKYPKAPDFAGIERWINSEPLNMNQLRDKVVLVDFWTYTCINCIRTLPYLKDWDKKYRDDGLVIVGVHTPEFEFEKKYENVIKAVNNYQVEYPVAQDNDYATWRAYENRFWPHKFLIDADGYVRYDHIGEGGYGDTELMIRQLLEEKGNKLKGANMTKMQENGIDYSKIGTPEIYFGYQFDRGSLGYGKIQPDSIVSYEIPQNPYRNFVYLRGQWKYNADNMELVSDEGDIFLIFDAKKINMVAGSDNKSDSYALLDMEFLNEKTRGEDVALKDGKSTVDIDEYRLYNVASAEDYGTHTFELQVAGKGFKIYTFTFG